MPTGHWPSRLELRLIGVEQDICSRYWAWSIDVVFGLRVAHLLASIFVFIVTITILVHDFGLQLRLFTVATLTNRGFLSTHRWRFNQLLLFEFSAHVLSLGLLCVVEDLLRVPEVFFNYVTPHRWRRRLHPSRSNHASRVVQEENTIVNLT